MIIQIDPAGIVTLLDVDNLRHFSIRMAQTDAATASLAELARLDRAGPDTRTRSAGQAGLAIAVRRHDVVCHWQRLDRCDRSDTRAYRTHIAACR
jgi:hypothetical protein